MSDTNASDRQRASVERLIRLLDVEQIDVDLFLGRRKPDGRGRIFGGEVIAQALQAAQRSTPDRAVHSLHAYFLRAGDEAKPIIFRVTRDFDGGSFSNRRVVALQGGVPILNMTASFHRREQGVEHHASMPDLPPPEELESDARERTEAAIALGAGIHPHFTGDRPIEVRPVQRRDWLNPGAEPPIFQSWIKTIAPIGDEPELHRAILAYASDLTLLGTTIRPHSINVLTPGMRMASLDHALWIHDDFRADDWLLYCCDSPWAGNSRGFARGQIFARDGRMVASVAQEGLVRYRSPQD